ncbi:hypothetical protein RUMCAL_02638 [Ruminococcus callidus ATCC 27760]|uniref:Uncharacterized protein n=1 Tax=Ruminococcus callidus ATCC 27760 TaxID=411473 RepID=U2KG47_9FIRM|nr:hypothetical protein RUMCAL_02638 [Ruminococcus callidus ATCC 27760]
MGFVEKPPCRTNEIYSYLRLAIFPVSCYTKGYAGIAATGFGIGTRHRKCNLIIPYLIENCKQDN